MTIVVILPPLRNKLVNDWLSFKQLFPNVKYLCSSLECWMNISQYLPQMIQASIRIVVIPWRNFNSIVFVVHIVFPQIVYNDGSREVSVEQVKVLDIDLPFRHCMVSIKSVRDEVWRVDLVQNPVSIGFGACCKDDYFIHVSHLTDEAEGIRADSIVAAVEIFMGV